MKNTIKAGIGLTALAMTNIALANNGNNMNNMFNKNSGQASSLSTTSNTLDAVIVKWIGYLTGFLYLVALIIGLWGAFNILTASGDEEKVKTGKAIILRAVLGIIAIFSINIIMKFVISALFGNS